MQDRSLIATIGDEDTITGLLLAGTGHINAASKKNFLIVDNSVSLLPLPLETVTNPYEQKHRFLRSNPPSKSLPNAATLPSSSSTSTFVSSLCSRIQGMDLCLQTVDRLQIKYGPSWKLTPCPSLPSSRSRRRSTLMTRPRIGPF